jgi:hypothetical protein
MTLCDSKTIVGIFNVKLGQTDGRDAAFQVKERVIQIVTSRAN